MGSDKFNTDFKHWYKDAIIYQLHVRTFYDANGDGVGDFQGLTAKLDYIVSLGVNTLWLMPFFKSPGDDDGYDVTDFKCIDARYGSFGDFREFICAAHERGLRIIIELVLNHTSDEHPWFQRARHAAPGSSERDFYVWSEDDQKFSDARVIFTDSENSNWTWDPIAGAHYWHRFYEHQPDLNYRNPDVLRSILDVMHFWLDFGVDGFRLDAVPYLMERDGTSSESLPETHEILRTIRQSICGRDADIVLLAEANQQPERVMEYFGDGDECQMAFHFPLMPQLFMAVAKGIRQPIVSVVERTNDIPESCQWAIFLRNHDELSLEMVTRKEREEMWSAYAPNEEARINLGIRRRLAPLMDNDRSRIELMHSLLLSLQGSPVIYYGDEIGMGDNIKLEDRHGVRTPMQWSDRKNAEFSSSHSHSLTLPIIDQGVHSYELVNVEAQEEAENSLLNWIRQAISIRTENKCFSRGTCQFRETENEAVLSYVRESGNNRVLCMFNLSSEWQETEFLAAPEFGKTSSLLGKLNFVTIGDSVLKLRLKPYQYVWLALS